jgi:hypothetical protein
MIELVIAAIVGGVILYFVFRWRNRKKQQVDDLKNAVNDTYSYLDGVVNTADVREALSASGLAKAAAEALRDKLEAEAAETAGDVILAARSVNIRRGLQLEADIRQWEDEISTTAEYKRYCKEKSALESRLDMWQDISGLPFPVTLPQRLRDRHTYVIGKSGAGKTTLLTWLVFQDLLDGQGMAFLTPEAETIADDLLPHVPETRRGDVIYFNPADEQCRFSFNPLHLRPGEDIDRKVEAVFTSITRLMKGGSSARINQILRQAIYALVERPDTTLLDIPKLLDRGNPHYRKQIIANLDDPQTKRFWRDTYEGFPTNAHVPILTRLARFIRPRRVRNVLCRREPGLNFREIMDSGKILLCSLPDGLLGETVSELLGGLIMSELQLAAVSRADTPAHKRRRFYVYLDEFHSFTGHGDVSYEKLLSRARKYRLPLTLAHQQTGQLSADLVREVFGNVSTLISFLVSRQDANRISRECIRDDRPEPESIDPTDLLQLDVGEAFAKVGTHAFPIRVTTTLDDFEADRPVKEQIIAASRRPASDADAGDPVKTEAATEADDVPEDPFADLADPQDLY